MNLCDSHAQAEQVSLDRPVRHPPKPGATATFASTSGATARGREITGATPARSRRTDQARLDLRRQRHALVDEAVRVGAGGQGVRALARVERQGP